MGFQQPTGRLAEIVLVLCGILLVPLVVLKGVYRDSLRQWEYELWEGLGVNPELVMGSFGMIYVLLLVRRHFRRNRPGG